MKKLLLILLCLPMIFGCGGDLDKEITKEITMEMIVDGYTGKGTYTYGSGGQYAGEWKDGKKDGKGTYTYGVDGTVEKGLWENDKFVGE